MTEQGNNDKDKKEESPRKPSSATLSIMNYDKASAKLESMARVPLYEDKVKMLLGRDKEHHEPVSSLRKYLFDTKVLSARMAQYSFCTKDGAVVGDSTLLFDYFQMVAETKEAKEASDTNVTAYILSDRTALDETMKNFLSQKQDLDLDKNKQDTIDAKLGDLKSSFSKEAYAALQGSAAVIHPADMSEKHWSIVTRTNSLCNGFRVLYTVTDPKSKNASITPEDLERTMFTAFAVSPRGFSPYEVSFAQVDKERDIQVPDATFRIPRFRIDDDSSVDVFETETRLESAMAESSFSKSTIEASAGGGAFGFSLGASMGFAKSDTNKSAQKSSSDVKTMHIRYNFPRVVLQLDENSLELSKEAKADMDQILARKSFPLLKSFCERYGHFFATQVQLGGTLFSSEASSIFGDAQTDEKASAFKAAASVSFSSPYVQASVSASHEQQKASVTSQSSNKFTGNIAWKAVGGDTLLCNNPPAWCSTVASFYNWRVIKQDKIVPVTELIMKILKKEVKYQNIDSKIDEIVQSNHPDVVNPGFSLLAAGDQPLMLGESRIVAAEMTSVLTDQSGSVPEEEKEKIDTFMQTLDQYSTAILAPKLEDSTSIPIWIPFGLGHDPSQIQTGILYNTDYQLQSEESQFLCAHPLNAKYIPPFVLGTLMPEDPKLLTFVFQSPSEPTKTGPIGDNEEVCIIASRGGHRIGSLVGADSSDEQAKADGLKLLKTVTNPSEVLKFRLHYRKED